MRPLKSSIISFLILLGTVSTVSAQQYSTVRIYLPENKAEKAEILGMLEVDHYISVGDGILAEIDQYQLQRLKRKGTPHQVLVEDVKSEIQRLNQQYYSADLAGRVAMEQSGSEVNNIISTPSAFQVQGTLGGFYSFSQMNTAMNNLVAAYPSIAQKFSLGNSTEGRAVWCIKISDNVATDETNEPEILFLGLQHAREAIGGSSSIFFMQWLCENYSTDPRVQSLVNNREIFIIPCMNPDGWEYNRIDEPNGGGGWRKNRRNNGDGTHGVDLNRNWSIDWSNCGGAGSSCGSGSTSSDTYYGPSAFSEPETNAVRNFVLSHHIVACLDQHSFGPYYSLPFGRPSLHTGLDSLTNEQQDFYQAVPAMMGKYNGMRAGNSIQSVGYEVAGGVKDWMLKGEIGNGTKGIVYGMTGEGGAGGGTGGSYGSFWPPASQIVNLCKGIAYQNLQLVLAAGSYVEVTDRSAMAVNLSSGSFNFELRRVGLGDQPATVTLVPIENITSVGSAELVSSIPDYYETFNGAISYTLASALPAGARIRYIWRVETGGTIIDDTITKLFNPVMLFYDDMESGPVSSNWIVSANWNYTSARSFSGSRSLTESPAGLYGANRNDNIRYNGTFDLSDATAAYLGFWVRHRAENFRDKLQVQVSTNGTIWIPVAGKTTVQEDGTLDGSTINGEPGLTGIREEWIPEQYDLSPWLGQPALRLRFVFTSDANTTGYDFQVDDGFNIDEVRIMKSTASMSPLALHFIDLKGQLTRNKTIALDWETNENNNASIFVIERSADGREFIAIGTVENKTSFIDNFPRQGYNFYKVHSMESSIEDVYSKVVRVLNNSLSMLIAYPNPVRDELNIRLYFPVTENITISITDGAGHLRFARQFLPEQEIRIKTNGWPSQLYFITVHNSKKEFLGKQSFILQ